MVSGYVNGTIAGLMTPAIIAFIAAFVVLILIIGLILYVYIALALYSIAKKLKYKYPWLAWIPFADGAMILQLGKFHWAWIFLVLIPFFGWVALAVLLIISFWRIFEKRKYPGWLALISVIGFIPILAPLACIAFLVVLGFVAWKK